MGNLMTKKITLKNLKNKKKIVFKIHDKRLFQIPEIQNKKKN
jgi:hypothetical protein